MFVYLRSEVSSNCSIIGSFSRNSARNRVLEMKSFARVRRQIEAELSGARMFDFIDDRTD